NAPTATAGLQLWLGAYDPARYFSAAYADPLPLDPFPGMATRSTIDSSSNRYNVSTIDPLHQVLYATDATIDSSWNFKAQSGGTPWRVNTSSGSSAQNFNFVQNTGVFTLSTFVNIGSPTGVPMTLFDTNEAQTGLAGFSLYWQQNGNLQLVISGGTAQTVRFN